MRDAVTCAVRGEADRRLRGIGARVGRRIDAGTERADAAGGTERPDADAGTVRPDAGAGTVLAVGVVAATAVLAGLLVPVAGVAVARHRATTAADAAALAAADAIIGLASGDPCERAAAVASADGASVLRCVPDGLVVTIRVRVEETFIPIEADATAGPAP